MNAPVDLLIFAMEAGRYGPARLPQTLESVGLKVATLCPDDNVLAHTDHVSAAFPLPKSRSARRLLGALAAAVEACRPALLVPGDEQAVALLHHAIWGGAPSFVTPALRNLLLDSLGPADQLGAMLYKHETIALARQCGVRVPAGGAASSAQQAVDIARGQSYPVYIKQSFGWAGQGVVRCENEADVRAGFAACSNPPSGAVKTMIREALGRDWYPQVREVDVQAAIEGRAGFYCALAWNGRMVGGFAGEALRTAGATGPSCEVRIGPNAAMADASERMIEAMGCTGWIGFDFLSPGEGGPVLIECNPRPIQVCHLGYRIGVDLVRALAELLHGGDVPSVPMEARDSLDILLFPHALDPMALRAGVLADMPVTDGGLMRFAAGLHMAQGETGNLQAA